MTKKTHPEKNEELHLQEDQVEVENNDISTPEMEPEVADVEVEENSTKIEPEAEGVSAEHRRIEELENRLAEAKDQLLRSLAEVENTRKRANRDVVAARKSALKSFARQLIPVADNFDRALDAISSLSEVEAEQPLIVGLRLSLQEFTSTLNEAGVRSFNPKGEEFDPEVHEAVSMFPTADAEPNSVVEVTRIGYYVNDELLRAAQVVVAQALPVEEQTSDE